VATLVLTIKMKLTSRDGTGR